jgi:hypothetical protein
VPTLYANLSAFAVEIEVSYPTETV